MAKKTPDTNEDDEDVQEKTSGIGGLIWIIPIIAIILLGWIVYLWFNFDPNDNIMGATLDDWKIGSIFILMILIVVLILVHPSGKLAGKPESDKRASTAGRSKKAKSTSSKESKSTKMVVIEALESEKETQKVKEAEIIAPPAKKVTPDILEYPKKIEGGIYGDTFIKVNEGTTLKLRSLVVEDVYLS